jgi:hypothetical protein
VDVVLKGPGAGWRNAHNLYYVKYDLCQTDRYAPSSLDG